MPAKDESNIEPFHALSYATFSVIAVKAIQEQQQELKILQHKLDVLKNEPAKKLIAEQDKLIAVRQTIITAHEALLQQLENE